MSILNISTGGGEDDPTALDPEITNPDVGIADADSNAVGQAQAQKAANAALENLDAETKEFIKEFQQRWGGHYARLTDERKKKVAELAAKPVYDIQLQKPTGGKAINPLNGKEEVEYSDEWETKKFTRKKLNQNNYNLLQEMKAKLAEEEDPVERVKLHTKIQEGQAYMYLGMKPEDFRRTDLEEMRLIIEACVERTRWGLPNSQMPSKSSSQQAGLA